MSARKTGLPPKAADPPPKKVGLPAAAGASKEKEGTPTDPASTQSSENIAGAQASPSDSALPTVSPTTAAEPTKKDLSAFGGAGAAPPPPMAVAIAEPPRSSSSAVLPGKEGEEGKPRASVAPGAGGAAAAALAAAGGQPRASMAAGGTPPSPPGSGDGAPRASVVDPNAAAAAAAAAGGGAAERKSKDKDAPPGGVAGAGAGAGAAAEEKKKLTLTAKEGKGAIAAADKGAVELAGKVKNFFNAAEGARLKEEAMKALRRPKKQFQNSYRLEPHVPYCRDKVQQILEETLEEMIQGVYYQSETAGDLAVKMATTLRKRVLDLKFDRYKVIIMTNVGPLNRQGIHIGFRGLLDQERDTYNMATAKSTHAFVTAVIYAVYFE